MEPHAMTHISINDGNKTKRLRPRPTL